MGTNTVSRAIWATKNLTFSKVYFPGKWGFQSLWPGLIRGWFILALFTKPHHRNSPKSRTHEWITSTVRMRRQVSHSDPEKKTFDFCVMRSSCPKGTRSFDIEIQPAHTTLLLKYIELKVPFESRKLDQEWAASQDQSMISLWKVKTVPTLRPDRPRASHPKIKSGKVRLSSAPLAARVITYVKLFFPSGPDY